MVTATARVYLGLRDITEEGAERLQAPKDQDTYCEIVSPKMAGGFTSDN